jgi:hypothetical protein
MAKAFLGEIAPVPNTAAVHGPDELSIVVLAQAKYHSIPANKIRGRVTTN